jgi:SAM-dependent methyltransferase
MIPASLRLSARKAFYFPVDTWDKMTGKLPEGIPPRGLIFVGHGDYINIGKRHLGYFRDLAGLKPEHRVLDIGCGIGRMAYPLTGYLSEKGSYDGFDIVKSGIDWCKRNISQRFPNFRFLYTGMYNQLYNTRDKADAGAFNFPYPDGCFDFVILTSVFTHMMPAEVSNYIVQIARVMKPGARCFVTFFVLNQESVRLMKETDTHMNFPNDKGFYRLHSARVDTANVAYEESWISEQLENNKLEIESLHYGQWCGRRDFLDYQDILILKKAD